MDEAEKFLRKHDPMYRKNNKRKAMEYSYLSSNQMKKHRVEIPESNLRTGQRMQAAGKGLQSNYKEHFEE